MNTAIYPGTFDPFTLGHIDLAQRASQLFDKVIIAVAESKQKKTLFTFKERVAQGQQLLAEFSNIDVLGFDGLLVEFAARHQAKAIVRGVRTMGDFDFELQLARMNRHLQSDIETIFILPSEKYTHISATLVREIAMLGGDVASLVPAAVKQALDRKRER